MILFMTEINTQGRARIGALVKAVMAWEGMSGPKLAAAGGRPSLPTINRIKAGEVVSEMMLAALGHKLGLPRDFLIYVGTGDVERIAASGADPDLVRWTLDLVEADRSLPEQRRGASGE